ncbi:alkanesulfonate monooxygenase [Geodermatophilus sp. Leaf369]|uniref:LLM class flavin-dependent oxidoreductase n=1 Tax=Geodermatophilus sp. Leaf369 TaxID=1736354 RepID=UPI0006F9411D|nr:LLM class flavin-dependent oxidoreductase [Geodermatophilus sp. Leaf369]KQS58458.1 alkanesulfonate monooxygenase [Geodermatophilus sp. Leaf369]
MEVHWFLPTRGDSRDVGPATTDRGHNAAALRRRPTLDYLGAVAGAAEQAGFTAVLTPTGSGCEDAWVTCAALLDRTQTLHFLVAFRPGFILPTLAAQQAASFQRLSGGRLRLNVVTGGDPVEQRSYGDFLDHAARYARTGEFLDVLRRCLAGERFDVHGEHVQAESAGLSNPPDVVPPVYLGGASTAAEDVSARFVDTYLTWGEPPSMVRERLDRVRQKAADQGRTIRFGIRLHVVSRDTPELAWAEADRMLAGMPASAIAATQERFARMDSVGQARMASLHGGSVGDGARSLEVAPNLWAGIGLVREGAATALVGSHEQVAERITEYAELGFDEFVLSGYPHLEEAWRVGEEVLPLLAHP